MLHRISAAPKNHQSLWVLSHAPPTRQGPSCCKGAVTVVLPMQSDNHLVLQDADSKVIWAPDVYIGKDGHQWKEGGYAVLQDDGNLVVYDGDGKAMWATAKNGGRKGSTDGGIWKSIWKGKLSKNYCQQFPKML